MSIVFKGKKGAGTITVDSGSATVGTRSSCHLVLEDPMAAERHAAIHQDQGRFYVEDLKTSSGTYLNGLPVEGRLEIPADGESSIVLGVSRLLATVDRAKGVLNLNVKEASFFYDKKEDPLAWVRSEVEFGRFRPVRIGNWAGLGLVALVFGLSFVDPVSDPLLQPGPLADVHAQAVQKSGGDSCGACHQPLKGTPPERCGPCHESIVRAPVHPPTWEGRSCQPCHVDHAGRDRAVLIQVAAKDTCGDCHEADRKPASFPGPAPVQPAWVALAYDTFPHAAHLTDKARGLGVEGCRTCHEALPAGAALAGDKEAGRPEREFARIPFEKCQKCHAKTGTAGTAWDVTWHGTDQGPDKCTQCHAEVNKAALRTTERTVRPEPADPVLLYSFTARDHRPQLQAHPATGPEACITCHKDGIAGGVFPYRDRVFPHGVHLSALAAGDTEAAAAIDKECRECHTEQAAAAALSVPGFKGPGGDCKECHTDGIGAPTEPARSAATGPVTDFPHRHHMATSPGVLEKGCLSCHTLPLSAVDAHLPATYPESRSCKPCHEVHRNVGGGVCDRCHAPGDPAYSGTPILRPWPLPDADERAFSHQSRGHAPVDCSVCHLGTEGSKKLSDLLIPAETDPSCRECHIRDKARFHFK